MSWASFVKPVGDPGPKGVLGYSIGGREGVYLCSLGTQIACVLHEDAS